MFSTASSLSFGFLSNAAAALAVFLYIISKSLRRRSQLAKSQSIISPFLRFAFGESFPPYAFPLPPFHLPVALHLRKTHTINSMRAFTFLKLTISTACFQLTAFSLGRQATVNKMLTFKKRLNSVTKSVNYFSAPRCYRAAPKSR